MARILIIVLLICTEQLGGTRKVSIHLALSFFVSFSPRNTFLAHHLQIRASSQKSAPLEYVPLLLGKT